MHLHQKRTAFIHLREMDASSLCSTSARRLRGTSSYLSTTSCRETETPLSACVDCGESTASSSLAPGTSSGAFQSRSCSFESTSLCEMEADLLVARCSSFYGVEGEEKRRNTKEEAPSELDEERSGLCAKPGRCQEVLRAFPEGRKKRRDKKKGATTEVAQLQVEKPRRAILKTEYRMRERDTRSPEVRHRTGHTDTDAEEEQETKHLFQHSNSPFRGRSDEKRSELSNCRDEGNHALRPLRRKGESNSQEASLDRESRRQIESRRREKASIAHLSQLGKEGEEAEGKKDTKGRATVGKKGARSRRLTKNRVDQDEDNEEDEEDDTDADWEATLPRRQQPSRIFRASRYQALLEEAKNQTQTKKRTSCQQTRLSSFYVGMWESSEGDDDWSPERVFGREQARRLLKSKQSESSSEDEEEDSSSEATEEDGKQRGPAAGDRVVAGTVVREKRSRGERTQEHRVQADRGGNERGFPAGQKTSLGGRSRTSSESMHAENGGERARGNRQRGKEQTTLEGRAAVDGRRATGSARGKRNRSLAEEGRNTSKASVAGRGKCG
ncbi:hypothetical protein TGVEG_202430 [Toxoplasma gondii VEG]|uniref:Uncharacterized protein n=2 Tax=Toxoplasma gondii (strain ATCC 50861 / VEG) TaxID=432359 RepID=V4ZL63_TOXGV|nr:hypothetical protein TGVEG_202430 [Toxoplasma gondii VEG]